MGSSSRKYESVESEEEAPKELGERPDGAPRAWPGFMTGAGQFEFQDYDTWTPEEKEQFKEGKLKSKFGFGQVSIRMPIDGPLTYIAILYGYLPFIIPGTWIIWAAVTWIRNGYPRFFPMCGATIATAFAIVNELVTKQLCKRLLPKSLTARPPESVCKHPGMPSGHVMNAYTLMVWCLLEAAIHNVVYPEWVVLILLLLFPVPWARVYNRDHTDCQVTVSMIIAVVMGIIAYAIRRHYFPGHKSPWDWYHTKYGFHER